jgi:hypothetical protein
MNNDPKQGKPPRKMPVWLEVLLVAAFATLVVLAVDVALSLAGVENIHAPIPRFMRAVAAGVSGALGMAAIRAWKSARTGDAADRPRD